MLEMIGTQVIYSVLILQHGLRFDGNVSCSKHVISYIFKEMNFYMISIYIVISSSLLKILDKSGTKSS